MDYKTLLSKRLKLILDEYYDGNFSAMSRDIGVTDTGLGSYIRGKIQSDGSVKLSTPSADVIATIVEKLEINSEWLISGVGEMKKNVDHEGMVKESGVECNSVQSDLLSIIKSQQEVISSQSRSIEQLTKKNSGTVGDAKTARVKKAK